MDAALLGVGFRVGLFAHTDGIIRTFGHSDMHGGRASRSHLSYSVIRGIIVPRRSYKNGAYTHIPETLIRDAARYR